MHGDALLTGPVKILHVLNTPAGLSQTDVNLAASNLFRVLIGGRHPGNVMFVRHLLNDWPGLAL